MEVGKEKKGYMDLSFKGSLLWGKLVHTCPFLTAWKCGNQK